MKEDWAVATSEALRHAIKLDLAVCSMCSFLTWSASMWARLLSKVAVRCHPCRAALHCLNSSSYSKTAKYGCVRGVMHELHCHSNDQSHSLIVDDIAIIMHKQAELPHTKSSNKDRCALRLQSLQLVCQENDCRGVRSSKQDSYC